MRRTTNVLLAVGILVGLTISILLLAGCRDGQEAGAMNQTDAQRPGPQTRPAGGQGGPQKATFGAGCFWGVEAAFRKIAGVLDTAVGYGGGHRANPTYRDVCSGTTGHAEVVQVTYDPQRVSYEQLLEVFWRSHDPTQVNRQGPDVGEQYRSVIFHHGPAQAAAAEASKRKQEQSGRYRRPIATRIEPAGPFWRAEEYHQRYLEKRGLASCHIDLQPAE
jgi:peptide-methionine (S)-S-oxide reductase